jgi:flagellar protein FliO/FliZ
MNAAMPMSALLWFAAIVVMIPLALWLLKRTPLGGAASVGGMRSISAMPLSNTQRLLTVEVGQGDQRRWLVLGVTPHTINLLHTMEPAPDAVVPSGTPVAGTAAASFAQMLGRVRGNSNGADREP